MSAALTRRAEWDRIRAERAATRADLLGALGGLGARARDPFGLKEKFRKHPYLFAGAAAGLGALLVNLLAGRGSRSRAPRKDDDGDSAPDEPSRRTAPLLDALRDAAMRLAMPWVARLIAEHLGDEAQSADAKGRPEHGASATAQRN